MYALMNKVWTAKANLATKKKKGFTLIEMIVVMAIIAILAAILVPMLAEYMKQANLTTKTSTARSGYTAAAAWGASQMLSGGVKTSGSETIYHVGTSVETVECIKVDATVTSTGVATGKLASYFSNLAKSTTVEAYVEIATGAAILCVFIADNTPATPTDKTSYPPEKAIFPVAKP